MKLKILSIHEKGDASKEHVVLEATDDCTLSSYALADTTYISSDKISNKLRHFYWFQSQNVSKANRVVLRTGKGKDDTYVTSSGITVFRYFWGLSSSVWNDDGDAAVLFELNDWNTKRA